jgi:hypothetical protein
MEKDIVMSTGGILSKEDKKKFNAWIEDGNAIEVKPGIWVEQTTQYSKRFTLDELKEFFKREFKTGGRVEATKKVRELLGSENYEKFVKELNKLADDPKVMTVLSSGLFDGKKKDEAFGMKVKDIPAKNLVPTQNEIDVDKSLSLSLSAKFPDTLERMLDGTSVEVVAPVVVLNDKYILDGHHRWSQIYALNKDANVKVLSFYGDIEPIEMLKVLQIAIATELAEVPTSVVKGRNLMTISEKELERAVKANLSDKAIKMMRDYNKIDRFDKNLAVDYVMDNIRSMRKTSKPIKDAPSRAVMPQTTEAKHTLDNTRVGTVNYMRPFGLGGLLVGAGLGVLGKTIYDKSKKTQQFLAVKEKRYTYHEDGKKKTMVLKQGEGFSGKLKSNAGGNYVFVTPDGKEMKVKQSDFVLSYQEGGKVVTDAYGNEISQELIDEFVKNNKPPYVVWNNEDNLLASPKEFKTVYEAIEFMDAFRKRYEKQGYYRNNRWEQIAPEDIDLDVHSKADLVERGFMFNAGGKVNEIIETMATEKNNEVHLNVSGGVGEITHAPNNIRVELYDYDNAEDEDYGEGTIEGDPNSKTILRIEGSGGNFEPVKIPKGYHLKITDWDNDEEKGDVSWYDHKFKKGGKVHHNKNDYRHMSDEKHEIQYAIDAGLKSRKGYGGKNKRIKDYLLRGGDVGMAMTVKEQRDMAVKRLIGIQNMLLEVQEGAIPSDKALPMLIKLSDLSDPEPETWAMEYRR